MKQWLLDNSLPLITTIIGGTSFIGYIQERKKRKIEEKALSADALMKMQEAYDRFAEHSNTNYKELLIKYQELTSKYAILEKRYENIERELKILKTKS